MGRKAIQCRRRTETSTKICACPKRTITDRKDVKGVLKFEGEEKHALKGDECRRGWMDAYVHVCMYVWCRVSN